MKKMILALTFLLSSATTFAAPSWDTMSDEQKIDALSGYSRVDYNIRIEEVKEFEELEDGDARDFVLEMLRYLDENSEVYNPDFPFDKNIAPQLRIKFAYAKNSRLILGGSLYVIRSLTDDAGDAWISGTFDYPLTYVGGSGDREDPIRWSHH